jgi:predicted RNase H-like HicB family nuclease
MAPPFSHIERTEFEKLLSSMHAELSSVIERDGDWFIGYCPQVPGANGQGKSAKECLANLAAAIALILYDSLASLSLRSQA